MINPIPDPVLAAAVAQLPQHEEAIQAVVTGDSICCLRTRCENLTATIRDAVVEAVEARLAPIYQPCTSVGLAVVTSTASR